MKIYEKTRIRNKYTLKENFQARQKKWKMIIPNKKVDFRGSVFGILEGPVFVSHPVAKPAGELGEVLSVSHVVHS